MAPACACRARGLRAQPPDSRLCTLDRSTCGHLDRGWSAATPAPPPLGAPLRSGNCSDACVSFVCRVSWFCLLSFFFFLTRKRLIVSPSATILALMSHEQRILSLCSPKRAWRQFSRRRTKTTLAVSTVHSRFRNVTRHVHPCPGRGLLADLHLTSAGRRETDTERPRADERHHGTHARTLCGSLRDLKPLLNLSNQTHPITLSVTS